MTSEAFVPAGIGLPSFSHRYEKGAWPAIWLVNVTVIPFVIVTLCGPAVITGGSSKSSTTSLRLLPGPKSRSFPEKLARLVHEPATLPTNVTVTCAEALAAIVSNEQRTVSSATEQAPWEDCAETIDTPAGTTFVNRTAVAAAGPAFETLRMQTALLPVPTGFGELVEVRRKSCTPCNVSNSKL